MARFFKFHSLAELEAECGRLDLDLRFTEDLSPLFRPVTLGPFKVGNSLCVQPMEGCDGTLDGRPDARDAGQGRGSGAPGIAGALGSGGSHRSPPGARSSSTRRTR